MQLRGHESLVKGVAWDPQGEYLASQSDDRTMKLWDVKTGKILTSVSNIFKNQTDKVFFKRPAFVSFIEVPLFAVDLKCDTNCLIMVCVVIWWHSSWSPDGRYLIASSAVSNKNHMAALYKRGEWDNVLRKLQGHKNTVNIVVRIRLSDRIGMFKLA
jgi:protein HIRA/HIR1